MRSFLLKTLLSVSLATTALAQGDRGTVTGTVSDPQGAIVPNATVQLRNSDTGSQFQTITTDTGNYTLPNLPIGNYELTVELSGFKRYTQSGIRIQVAQIARIDVILAVGSTTETVNVTADAPLLKTENAEISHNITSEQMNALPLNFAGVGVGNMRTPYAFLQLTPGGNITPSGNSYNIRINGSPANTLHIRVEGQEASHTLQPGSPHQVQPSVEALQEVSVQTSNFSAEYGEVAGGMFNLTTKSGTNRLRGSVYEYFVNEAFNAGQAFTNDGSGDRVRSRQRKHDFGGSLGGPVVLPKLYDGRNRTFFFFNYEMYRHREIVTGSYLTVPTDAYRGGDFSAALTGRNLGTDPLGRPIMENAIYDPLTERTLASGQVVRDPFLNNVIPANRLNPTALKVQEFIPRADRAGIIQNWLQTYPSQRIQDIPSIKIDHNLNDRAKLSFFWTRYRTDHFSGQDGLPDIISAWRFIQIRSHTLRVNYDHSLTPTLLLHLGAGLLRYGNPDIGTEEGRNYDAYGILGLRGGAINGMPRFQNLNTNQGGMQQNIGPTNFNQYATEKPTGVASVTWVRSSHTIKFGGEFRIDTYTDRNTRMGTGVYGFSRNETALPYLQNTNIGGGSIGFPYASFLLGLVNNGSVAGNADPQLRKNSLSFFAQDTWKATRKLTLDYGLRWDYQQAPRELHRRQSSFDPNTPNPSAGGLLGAVGYEGYGPGRCNCTYASTYPYAFGPRLGAAYQIDQKTVLRAGWGITYGQTGNFNFITNTPMIGVGFNSLSFTAPAFGVPAADLTRGLVYDPAELYVATYDPGLRPSPGQVNSPPYWVDPNGGRPGRIFQWNVSLQRELTSNLVLEAAYVGNRGAWFMANNQININAVTPESLQAFGLDVNNAADRTLLTSAISSAAVRARGFNAPYAGFPSGQTLAQALRPYPQFGNIDVQYAPLGNTWYDSLQAKLTKRYSHGLDMTASFTWQKELTRGAENQSGGGAQVNDVFNREQNKYLSSFSQPFVFVIGANYELPKFSSSKVVRAALGGWTVSGIMKYASGLPIRVPAANTNLTNYLFRGTFANRVPGEPLFLKDLNCGCFDAEREFVLNPRAWQEPALGQFGNSAAYYNDYRFARRPDEQLSLGRTFRMGEGGTFFSIRGEFFNVFNRTYLNNPDSTNAATTPTFDAQARTISGFGRIATNTVFSPPRFGQIVARFQF